MWYFISLQSIQCYKHLETNTVGINLKELFGITILIAPWIFSGLASSEEIEYTAVCVEDKNTGFYWKNGYRIEQANHTQIRDTLIGEVHTHLDNLLKNAAQWIPFLAYQKGDVSKNIEKLSESVQKAADLYTQGKEDLAEQKGEVDTIVVAAREASASAGAAVFTKTFYKKQKILRKRSLYFG
jgi:hypothetical protein